MILPGTSTWSDYDGDEIYGDYVMDPQTGLSIEKTAYLPGIGQRDGATGEVLYFHGDQIGSLRTVSMLTGDPPQPVLAAMAVYTAFGEVVCGGDEGHPCGTGVSPADTRYQYAGEWGYESYLGRTATPGTAVPWHHLGYRWYSPSTGRFLQRDPIGMLGGLNVYTHVAGNPLLRVHPAGLAPDWRTEVPHVLWTPG